MGGLPLPRGRLLMTQECATVRSEVRVKERVQ